MLGSDNGDARPFKAPAVLWSMQEGQGLVLLTGHRGMGTRGWKLRQPEGGGVISLGEMGGRGIREKSM